MASPSSPIGQKSLDFLRSNDIEWTDIRPLNDDSKPVYRVRTQHEDYVLKCAPQPDEQPSLRPRLFRSLGFEQEIAAYRAFDSGSSDPNFAAPRLIAADSQNLLIELIADGKCISRERRLELKEQIAVAVYGLTTGTQRETRSWLRAQLHHWTYSAEGCILRSGLRLIQKQMGLAAACSALRVLLKCRSLQSPLRKTYWSHNDLSANNSILGPDHRNVYIIDFQDLTAERRWLLYDITRYCFNGPKDPGAESYDDIIDEDLIAHYLSHFGEDLRARVHLPAQIRFALLIDTVRSLSWRATTLTGASCLPLCKMLQNLVLSDRGYANWYARFSAKLQQSLVRLSCHDWLTAEGCFAAEAAPETEAA